MCKWHGLSNNMIGELQNHLNVSKKKSLSNNRQARQKGKYIMKKTFYKYTNKFLISMQMNTKKQIKNLN